MTAKRMLIGDEAGNLDDMIDATKQLGWDLIEMRFVEVPGFEAETKKKNIHDIPDPAFEVVRHRLAEANIQVHAFGSAIMNWGKKVTTPDLEKITMGEVDRAIPRMQALGAKYVRVMSINPLDTDSETPQIAYDLLKKVTGRFKEVGIKTLHENCWNFCGMTVDATRRMLDEVPDIGLLYDTGNPLFNFNRIGPRPWRMQDPQDWLKALDEGLIERVEQIHVKDVKNDRDSQQRDTETYHFPGEGDGLVAETVRLFLRRGYTGGWSMEPHMFSVFHDPKRQGGPDTSAAKANAIEYGQRFDALLQQIQAEQGVSAEAGPGGAAAPGVVTTPTRLTG